jgi:A/G-specific adenine glycosylase
MELGATVCTPRNPQCLVCPWAKECRTLGEHKTPKRAAMTSREIACALVVRDGDAGTEVLLEQRAATNTVMPGLWELPAIAVDDMVNLEERLTVRHAIMQVNYLVRVYALPMEGLREKAGGMRRWVVAEEASAMALTGLARKVLTRAGVLGKGTGSTSAKFASPRLRN